MSKYTIELRWLVSTFGQEWVEECFKSYELTDILSTDEINVIQSRGTWSKEKLAKRIVDEYWMREIGLETPAYFKKRAILKMREIMEMKLPLIYTTSLKIDPLKSFEESESVNTDTTSNGTSDATSSSSSQASSDSNGSSSGLNVNSDTPQGQISKSAILQGKYASSTSASENTSADHGESTNTANNTNKVTDVSSGNQKTTRTRSGYSEAQIKLLNEYRNNILTIDNDIIKELSPLFIGVF